MAALVGVRVETFVAETHVGGSFTAAVPSSHKAASLLALIFIEAVILVGAMM